VARRVGGRGVVGGTRGWMGFAGVVFAVRSCAGGEREVGREAWAGGRSILGEMGNGMGGEPSPMLLCV
jgi:hypothetical protein